MADALTRRFQATIARIGVRAAALTARQWADLGSWDEADVERFAQAAGPTLAAAKTSAVATGTAYYAVRAQLTRPPRVTADMVDVSADPRDPFIAYWRALKMGNPVEDAVLSGTARAGTIVRDLATSAARRSGDVLFERARVETRGWERVPDGGACEWCHEQTAYVYPSAEAADFGHTHCGCTPEPLL